MKKTLLLTGLLIFSLTGCENNTSHKKERPDLPNIIYIMADDLGYGDLSCYGQNQFETPNLDQMASEGMQFMRHYAGSTVCAPSRSALMEGKHTGHSFIRGNKPMQPEGQEPIADTVVTVAELLQAAGYKTGAMGKWGLGGPASEGEPNKQGFDYYYGYNCQREAHFFYPDHLWKNQERVELPENRDGQKQVYSQDLIIEESLDFIDRHQDEAFFLYLPYTIPHASLELPEKDLAPFKGKFEDSPYEGKHYSSVETPRAVFAAMVSRLDRDVGRVLKKVRELGLAENTLVIFTSDNGPHKEGGAQPEYFNSGGGLRGIKRDLYEGGIRVPMIAWWPGTVQAGAKNNHVSAFWDFLPTACDIAKVDIPENTDGISYLPSLKGQMQPEHAFLYWEFHEQGGKQAALMNQWKGIRLNMRDDPNADIALYNLSIDPSEQNNVATDHPDIVKEMAEIMAFSHEKSPIFPFAYEVEEVDD